MRYFISDLHFCHKGLNARMDKRGFGDTEQMNEYMIHRWNSRVHRNDEVIILGDFSFGTGAATNEILQRLNGRKCLIEGNHDWRFLKDSDFDCSLFKWIKPYAELKDNHRLICMCHYPIMCYNGQYRVGDDGAPRSYMLYGHVHNTVDETLVRNHQLSVMTTEHFTDADGKKFSIPCNMINCFCMFSDYVPLTLDEWIALRLKQLNVQNEINKKYSK